MGDHSFLPSLFALWKCHLWHFHPLFPLYKPQSLSVSSPLTEKPLHACEHHCCLAAAPSLPHPFDLATGVFLHTSYFFSISVSWQKGDTDDSASDGAHTDARICSHTAEGECALPSPFTTTAHAFGCGTLLLRALPNLNDPVFKLSYWGSVSQQINYHHSLFSAKKNQVLFFWMEHFVL